MRTIEAVSPGSRQPVRRGLTSAEAAALLIRDGPNLLPVPARVPGWPMGEREDQRAARVSALACYRVGLPAAAIAEEGR
jgi:Cation transporter/ATPase, N-terminus